MTFNILSFLIFHIDMTCHCWHLTYVLTPFDHIQIRPTFAVTPNLILESCRIQLFLLNIFQVQKKTHYIKIWMGWSAKSCRVWRIFKNFEYILFKYFPIQIFFCIIFVSFFCTNIFGYSFVLFFIRIYWDIHWYRFVI